MIQSRGIVGRRGGVDVKLEVDYRGAIGECLFEPGAQLFFFPGEIQYGVERPALSHLRRTTERLCELTVHAHHSKMRVEHHERLGTSLEHLAQPGGALSSPARKTLEAGLQPVRRRATVDDRIVHQVLERYHSSGGRTLDELLENKGLIDQAVAEHIQRRVQGFGLEVDSVGVKDIILPGEMKTILAKVVEAEKAAAANVIRRREETSATRSLLNTARVMEDNPVALRLKELETLEKVTEKIDKISVFGGLDAVLKDLVKILPVNR